MGHEDWKGGDETMINPWIVVVDMKGEQVVIPVNNISHVASHESVTRIYLKRVAGHVPGVLWYIAARESVEQIAIRLMAMT